MKIILEKKKYYILEPICIILLKQTILNFIKLDISLIVFKK